jgi:ankyrin repeat protein
LHELHHAARRGDLDRVRDFLRDSPDLGARDARGYTPLMHAVESKHASVEIVRLLLDHGADLNQTCQQYGAEYTVAAIGLAAGDPEKVRLLLNRGASLNYSRPEDYTAAHDALATVRA